METAMPASPSPGGDDGEELLTLQEAAELCTVGYETFRRWVMKGVLPHVAIGPHALKRVYRKDVEHLMRFVDR